MCQCVCCDCWWMNCCGIGCAGCLSAYICMSCWICKPQEAERIDPGCCKCCECAGYGGNCFCQGGVCCAPKYILKYSEEKTRLDNAGKGQERGSSATF